MPSWSCRVRRRPSGLLGRRFRPLKLWTVLRHHHAVCVTPCCTASATITPRPAGAPPPRGVRHPGRCAAPRVARPVPPSHPAERVRRPHSVCDTTDGVRHARRRALPRTGAAPPCCTASVTTTPRPAGAPPPRGVRHRGRRATPRTVCAAPDGVRHAVLHGLRHHHTPPSRCAGRTRCATRQPGCDGCRPAGPPVRRIRRRRDRRRARARRPPRPVRR